MKKLLARLMLGPLLGTWLAFMWAIRFQCLHDPANVVADVLEGDGNGYAVKHCRTCGCTRVNNGGWRP